MQVCDLTGKGKQYGNNVSFSQRHTKKVWKPNLQNKTVIVDGKKVKMKLSTEAIRTLKKKGLLGNGATKQTATLTK
jgi:large subunit ribosomal protein L28